MSNVIEFGIGLEEMKGKRLKRYEKLKIGYFQQSLTDQEESEMNYIEKWLKTYYNN